MLLEISSTNLTSYVSRGILECYQLTPCLDLLHLISLLYKVLRCSIHDRAWTTRAHHHSQRGQHLHSWWEHSCGQHQYSESWTEVICLRMVICATETPDIAEEQLQEDTWSFACHGRGRWIIFRVQSKLKTRQDECSNWSRYEIFMNWRDRDDFALPSWGVSWRGPDLL